MLFKRILTGTLLTVISIILIVWGLLPLALEVTAIVLLGIWEFCDLAERKGVRPSRITALIGGLVLMGAAGFGNESSLARAMLFVALYTFLIFIFRKDFHRSALLDAATTLMGVVYVGWMMSFILLMRKLPGMVELMGHQLDKGAGYVLLVVFATVLTDSMAFFVGRFLGRVRLCPDISPGKTMEGAMAGVLGSLLWSWWLGSLLGIASAHAIVLGLMIGILAQLGDMWESMLKREVKLKDSGEIVLGHGGILDRFDSLFFALPAGFLYLKYFVVSIMAGGGL